ncbi:glycosyltransferase [Bosea sp. (in: a-proteobacteria)]|uniref:glycosyltransferase n=1 Tax=Bosea sp. (in: a-proteobacteria) TaxID=1871050 RepID=UPI002FC8C68C
MADLLSPEAASTAPLAPIRTSLDIRHVVIDDCGSHPSAANGVHHVVRRMAREQLAAGDHAKILFLRSHDQDGGGEAVDLPTLILPLDGPRLAGRIYGLAEPIIAAMAAGAGPATVFHIHTARQLLLPALARALDRRALPFGVTVHGRYSHVFAPKGSVANWRTAAYLRLFERQALELARFVQAVSAAEAKIIARLAPAARVHVVPNAAYSSVFDGVPQRPARKAAFADFPVFGFCGRYEILHKGLDLLVEGFATYRRQGGRGRLVLLGTGPARDVLAAMAATLDIRDAIDIQGPCFGEEKHRKMADWHFFVQPSRFDGVPIAALEAALAGLPLVVSQETGLAEQVASANAGLVMRDLTANSVAEAFHKASLLSKDGWRSMTFGAHAMATQIGDWTPITAELRKLYLAE